MSFNGFTRKYNQNNIGVPFNMIFVTIIFKTKEILKCYEDSVNIDYKYNKTKKYKKKTYN